MQSERTADTVAAVHRAAIFVALIWVISVLAFALFRVRRLESSEMSTSSEVVTLSFPERSSGETPHKQVIHRVPLIAGSVATFEVCLGDPLEPDRWAGTMDVVARHEGSPALLVDMPFAPGVLQYAQRTKNAACLLLGFDEQVEQDGLYVVEVVYRNETYPAHIDGTPIQSQVIARTPLGTWDIVGACALLLGLLAALALALPRRPRWQVEDEDEPPAPAEGAMAPPSLLRPICAVIALVAVAVGLVLLPWAGTSFGFLRGIVVAACQVVLAAALVKKLTEESGRAKALAVHGAERARWLLWLAPLFGVSLFYLGDVLRSLVPATGEAPIQTFMSSPSGMLTVAYLSLVAAVAEELFFRGFLFGMLERRLGTIAAFFATWLLFTAAHLEQDWGAWGSVASVAVTGLLLTALRAITKSILVPVLVHVAHNGVIVFYALYSAG